MCTNAVAGYFRGLNTSVLRFFLRFRAAVRGRDKICGSKNHLGNLHLWHRRLPHTLPLFNAQNIDSSFWGLSVCPPTFQAHSHRCPLSLWLLLYSTGPKYIPRLFEEWRVVSHYSPTELSKSVGRDSAGNFSAELCPRFHGYRMFKWIFISFWLAHNV